MCMYPMSVLCLKRYQVPFDSSPMCYLFEKVLKIQKSFAHDVSRVIESYLYQHESLKIPGLGELWHGTKKIWLGIRIKANSKNKR